MALGSEEEVFRAGPVSCPPGAGEGGGVGYALVPELPITLSMLSRPLLLGRSHWYVIGCGDAGESARMLDSTWSEAAI